MHQGSARELSLSPSHTPSPRSLALLHPAPVPPPHCPTLPSGPFHTTTHTQPGIFFPLISFHSKKTGWRSSFSPDVTVETPLFFSQTCFCCNTYVLGECVHVGHLKFKGTKATAVLRSVKVLAFCLFQTKNRFFVFFLFV